MEKIKINYERTDKAAELIAAFKEEIKGICNKYTERMEKECPENIADPFGEIAKSLDNLTGIQFHNIGTAKELKADGFSIDFKNKTRVHYRKEYKGTNIVTILYRS